MRKLKKWLMALAMAAGVFSSTAMNAFAYTGDTGQTETAGEAAAGETQTVIPEQTESAGETEAAAQEEASSGVSEEEVKGLIAKAMKDFAATLMAE